MPSILSLNLSDKRVVAGIVGGAGILLVLFGILVGYSSAPGSRSSKKASCSLKDDVLKRCSVSPLQLQDLWQEYFHRLLYKVKEDMCMHRFVSCHNKWLPLTYLVYHLNGRTVTVDGIANETAWTEIPWTKSFVDIRDKGTHPHPRYQTKVKVRWDDSTLYILMQIEEKDLYGKYQNQEDPVSLDNAVSVFLANDGTLSNFRQIQTNVVGAVRDVMYTRSPTGTGNGAVQQNVTWTAHPVVSVIGRGTTNNANDVDTDWTVEMAMNFSVLTQNSSRSVTKPADNEVWFAQFLRTEWNLTREGNTYKKNKPLDVWAWQWTYTRNTLIPDRWGLIQFKRNMKDNKFQYDRWHLYKVLFEVRNALMKYQAINVNVTDSLQDLDVPIYMMSRVCNEIPTIQLGNGTQDWNVTVKSRIIKGLTGQIRPNGVVTFSQ